MKYLIEDIEVFLVLVGVGLSKAHMIIAGGCCQRKHRCPSSGGIGSIA